MTPRYFRSGDQFRRWLEKNHARRSELMLGFYNQRSGKKGITYREALDEALCFGWIDGVRKSVDDGRYMQRFTPRRARSVWSLVNIKRVAELEALGRMAAPGREAFTRRDPKLSGIYSFERERADLGPDLEKRFRARPKAWAFFEARPPGYRRLCAWFVVSAKKEETRLRRLEQLIAVCEKGKLLPGLEKKPRARTR